MKTPSIAQEWKQNTTLHCLKRISINTNSERICKYIKYDS